MLGGEVAYLYFAISGMENGLRFTFGEKIGRGRLRLWSVTGGGLGLRARRREDVFLLHLRKFARPFLLAGTEENERSESEKDKAVPVPRRKSHRRRHTNIPSAR